MPGLVTFVGAGPGDPELLTIKGQKAIAEASLILYAGSLVSPEILKFAPPDAAIHDSAFLTLEESHALVKAAAFQGKNVARVHTGDPSIFGALAEQIQLLDADSIPWRVIPGVTAAMAAAASCGISFSIPEVAQTLILTRLEGRTPMPEKERITSLAAHGSSMAIYLAGHHTERLQAELQSVLPAETPVICVSKVGWPEEKIVPCVLSALHRTALAHDMGKQTLFLILPYLSRGQTTRSRLYHHNFSHQYRKGPNNGQTGN